MASLHAPSQPFLLEVHSAATFDTKGFEVVPGTTVLALKGAYAAAAGAGVDQFILTRGNTPLEAARTLASYGITGGVLYVVWNCLGARPERITIRRLALVFLSITVILFVFEIHSLNKERPGKLSQTVLNWALPQTETDGTSSTQAALHDGQETILPTARGRVLVTGGGGMIGKRLVRRLLQANVPVTVLDVIFYDDEVDEIRTAYPSSDLRVVHGDIRDGAKLAEAVEGASGVVHLAAVSRVLWCLENLEDCNDVNVRGTEMVLNALPDKGWFIQASSREVYGDPETLPVVEDTPHNPANVYGRTKAFAEDVITRHVDVVTRAGSKKLNAIMLRLSNVYGSAKGHPQRLIPAIMNNALSNRPIQMVGGNQNLDMVHVDDVVDAFALAITRLDGKARSWLGRSHGSVEVFNVGTSSSTTAIELIRKTLWLTNSSSPLRVLPADDRFPSHYVGSTDKASSVLGYKARVSIDAGLHALASDTLAETVAFLARRQHEPPFECGAPKAYSAADVLALDGCTATLALRGEHGKILYNRFIRAGKDDTHSWNGTNKWEDSAEPTVWDVRARRSGDGEVLLSFRFAESYNSGKERIDVNHTLGVPEPVWNEDAVTEFRATVHPETGYLRLTRPDGGELQLSRERRRAARQSHDTAADEAPEAYNMRLTPVCCAGKRSPLPFFQDDPLASAVLDTRGPDPHAFNASQIARQCERFARAEAHARRRLATLAATSRPIVLQQAALPLGRAPDWRMRRLKDVCSVQCGHPTLCVDTGDCMCTHVAQCVPRARFPFAHVAGTKLFSYPAAQRQTDAADVLVHDVARMSWANVLNPDARRYFASKPEYPLLTAVKNPDDIEAIKAKPENEFWQLRNSPFGCFSADTVMERAAWQISQRFREDASLAFVPFYSFNRQMMFPSVLKAIDHAQTQLARAPHEIDSADMSMTFTHDVGRCNSYQMNIQDLKLGHQAEPARWRRVMAWQPMGDTNTPCYEPDQDVVIPSRTCLQEALRAAFSDVAKVKPARQRAVLATFKGRNLLAGSVLRQKLQCKRKFGPGALEGADALETWWGELRPGSDYLQTINETVFCPVPRGTTGWATRTIDVVYGGCIPVIFGHATHHPFWDVLDWSRFAVFVDEWDVQRVEEVLLSYTWAQVEAMQANLMLVRDALLYPAEPSPGGTMDEAVKEKGPFWYAVHSAYLRKVTRYPT
ncbi:hypothetical protein Q8F55_007185 [Vanrija albida]|uniref:Ubiquitin-like domain-containing protein n=1 Tax=Vanrija albida TaxID=181172 RepID=A0ABR3PZ63_9TREE